MATWRGNRQIIILSIVLGPVVLALLIAGYIALPNPSCVDNRQNQGETGVDCGGSCIPCEIKNPKPVKVYWVRALSIGDNKYDLAALIENPNEVLSSGSFAYEFVLSDTFGVITKKSGKGFIFSQERAYIIEAGITSERKPNKAEFVITDPGWELKEVERPNIAVGQTGHSIETEGSHSYSAVKTSITNRTPFNIREVEIRVVVFDLSDNIIGVNKIVLDNFRTGTQRDVTSTWPIAFKGAIGRIDVEPRANILDRSIISP